VLATSLNASPASTTTVVQHLQAVFDADLQDLFATLTTAGPFQWEKDVAANRAGRAMTFEPLSDRAQAHAHLDEQDISMAQPYDQGDVFMGTDVSGRQSTSFDTQLMESSIRCQRYTLSHLSFSLADSRTMRSLLRVSPTTSTEVAARLASRTLGSMRADTQLPAARQRGSQQSQQSNLPVCGRILAQGRLRADG
jgi:hypothetical protein